MASVAGIVEQARSFLPEFVMRRRAGQSDRSQSDRSQSGGGQLGGLLQQIEPQHPAPALSLATSQSAAEIAALIQSAVVPTLIETHRTDVATVDAARATGTAPRIDATAFALLTLEHDASELVAHSDALLLRGIAIEAIFIEVLAPAARKLGDMWDNDDCDFVDVTMGLWRLQEVVRELSARIPAASDRANQSYHGVFAAMPGEQHNFGTVIVEDVFRRAGWTTELLLDGQQAALLNAVARNRIDVVGLTVSCDTHIERLPSMIAAVRSVSRNPRLCILLGGRVLADDPGIVIRVGADGSADNPSRAVELAERLIKTNACREVFTA